MTLESVSVYLLMSLSTLLGVQAEPPPSTHWKVESSWKDLDGHKRFSASSSTIIQDCLKNPTGVVSFPSVIHGTQSIFIDGKLIYLHGDPKFESVRSFYGSPHLSCSEIKAGEKLTWQVDSYAHYFARTPRFPHVVNQAPLTNVFAETLHVIAAGSTLLMAFLTLTLFFGKVSPQLLASVSLACVFTSVYFALSAAGFLGIDIPMLTAHRFADIAVWIGLASLVNSFRLEGLVSKILFLLFVANVALGISIIAAGNTGDVIQMGTLFPFASSIFLLAYPFMKAVQSLLESGRDRRRQLQVLGLALFVFGCGNEMLVITGIAESPPMLPLAFVGGMFPIVLALNERIKDTYRERDYLRANLEAEVERKTLELRNKTSELESAMENLRSTQAELVQTAKLASLGTLSAGIAHEINNSINYVNGALQPLERLVLKSCPENERAKTEKLFGIMKEGLNLTIDIIKSLRNYTGLNQAKFNDVNLASVALTSLNILKSRTRGSIEVVNEVPADLTVYGNVVGINQIFMNLISNAIDAMPEGGNLKLTAQQLNEKWIEVKIQDSGAGMSPDVAQRIFEPFFTTKSVGKGTGLGLHIVRTEIEKHHGSIEVQSQQGKGTTFAIKLPASSASEMRRAA